MSKQKFIIKMGSYEPKMRGKKQPGLDLSRVVQDTLVNSSLATRSVDCCDMFTSVPVIETLVTANIPNNSIFSFAGDLYWKDSAGTLFTFDLTPA